MAFIYKTTNTVNGKIYIGKSKHNDPEYLGSGVILRDAIKKYGRNVFVKEILEECCDSIADEREVYYIALYESLIKNIGYNIAKGGTGGDTTSSNPNKIDIIRRRGNSLKEWHKNLSDIDRKITNQKISIGKKGKSNGRTGRVNTEETIEKMRAAAHNRKPSIKWKEAHLAAMAKKRGKPFPQKYKPVIVNGIEYDSVKHAQKALKISDFKYYRLIRIGKLKVKHK